MRGGGGDSGKFPMTTRGQVAEFLAGPEGATELIVFEFSGAMLMQRLADGVKAMGVDKRAPEHQGPCYQGDYRDVIDLKTWDCVYFIGPSCFQNIRPTTLGSRQFLPGGSGRGACSENSWAQ